MLNRTECWILTIKTFVYFKCNIEMDLDFYVRVRTCKERITGKQLWDSFIFTRPEINFWNCTAQVNRVSWSLWIPFAQNPWAHTQVNTQYFIVPFRLIIRIRSSVWSHERFNQDFRWIIFCIFLVVFFVRFFRKSDFKRRDEISLFYSRRLWMTAIMYVLEKINH